MTDRPTGRPKGWFVTADRDGDRTVDEQLAGLEPLLAEAPGMDILDLGCAEGLIAKALSDAGARWVLGVDARRDAIGWAETHLAAAGRLGFVCADLNDRAAVPKSPDGAPFDFSGRSDHDIVVMLSIAHKLDDPAGFIRRFAARARHWVVIRLPGPVIDRVGAGASHKKALASPVDVPLLMADLGFVPWRECPHPRLEWTWIYQRAPRR